MPQESPMNGSPSTSVTVGDRASAGKRSGTATNDPDSHGDVRHAVGSLVFTTRLQSSAMIISSQAVTDASLTVDVALQALPTQHMDMFPLMHSAKSTAIAQLAAF
jgi:hypothetical protein